MIIDEKLEMVMVAERAMLLMVAERAMLLMRKHGVRILRIGEPCIELELFEASPQPAGPATTATQEAPDREPSEAELLTWSAPQAPQEETPAPVVVPPVAYEPKLP